MAPKQLRAALYARYSTDKQRAESLEDQYHECEKVAAREGFKVVGRYGDKEVSGGTADRKRYQDMLDDARAGKFDVLISEDISRLWRSRAEFGPRSAELEDLGIHWLSCVGQDTRREGWGMMIQILQAMAEQQRREASYRTRRGLDGLARAGKNAGGKAYGYTSINKIRTVDPAQAKIVKQIYEWRAEGWSAQRIARQLNEDKVPSPGSSWNRVDTGPTRKTKNGWRPSAIAGDHTRGVGILNNPMYKGQVIWGRSKWTRSAANSDNRTVTAVESTEWITHEVPKLRIVSDELWDTVRAIQTATNPRREAIRRGILFGRNGAAKKAAGHDSKYFLGSLLVCTCGANYIGNGKRDYVCPAHISNSCENDMRFRRDDAHQAVYDLIVEHCLSDEQIEIGKARIEAALKERAKEEERAMRDSVSGADTKKLDQELRELRKMKLRPAAMAAAVAEIEKERAELLARAVGKQDKMDARARRLLARMPEIVAEYRKQMRQGLGNLTDQNAISAAREAARNLLVDGRIVLAPNRDRDAVTGPVRLQDLGSHMLVLAGWQRQPRALNAKKLSGSGGRI
jgi:site-specific DNA recombinase